MRKYLASNLNITVIIVGLSALVLCYIWSSKSQNENKIKEFCVAPTGLANILATYRQPNKEETEILLEWARWSQITPEIWAAHILDIERHCRKQRYAIPPIRKKLLNQ